MWAIPTGWEERQTQPSKKTFRCLTSAFKRGLLLLRHASQSRGENPQQPAPLPKKQKVRRVQSQQRITTLIFHLKAFQSQKLINQ